MKNIQDYLTNKDAPSGGFSQGKLRDDPGDATGSGITVLTHNDFLYALLAPVIKYLGDTSDTDESETAADVMDALETMAGVKNPNVSEYNNITAYVADDHVMSLGVQFVAMVATTGNEPFTNPDKWLPCFARDDAFIKWQKGDNITGGFDPLHDHRDGAYRQVFDWGKYNVGGDTGGVGRNFEAFGIHLDGTQVTGNGTLEGILDVGGGGEYHLLDIIAPDVVGTRTLLDTRGSVPACIDAGGGNRVIVGAAQADQFQGWQAGADESLDSVTGPYFGRADNDGNRNDVTASANTVPTVFNTGVQGVASMIKAQNDGANGDPRTGLETQMKNFSVGVTSILVINELP